MTNTQQCPCDCGGMCVLNADLDAAEATVQQLKQALHDARLENSGQAALLERLKAIEKGRTEIGQYKSSQQTAPRPEPSRLEIAAMVIAARTTSTFFQEPNNEARHALAAADALIAAAKGEK